MTKQLTVTAKNNTTMKVSVKFKSFCWAVRTVRGRVALKMECFFYRSWTYSWGRVGFRKGSLSAPFIALVLRCFGSEFAVRAWELLEGGGFLLASSFLCLSMSSLCWFIHSCCLRKKSRKTMWVERSNTMGRKINYAFYLSQQKYQEQ